MAYWARLPRRLVVENGRLDGETSTEHCGSGRFLFTGYGSSSVPLFVLLDAIYEKIPFMKGRNIDAQDQKRYGMVSATGDRGVVLGLIFGLAAGEGFKGCATYV